jgi:predicted nucleic acid-binding protein
LIVCDTSGVYAAYNKDQAGHEKCVAVLNGARGKLMLSSYVLTELDYLLRTRLGVPAEVRLLRDVRGGVFKLVDLEPDDLDRAADLIEQYDSLNLGLADVANVVMASRWRTTKILSLDERDFRVIRPLWGQAFTVLPTDA